MNKTTKNILLFSGIAVVGYFVYSKLKSNDRGGRIGPIDPYSGGGGTGGGTGDGTGGGVVFSEADNLRFRQYANDMWEAMNGCQTNEDRINETAKKIKSELEWQAVINAFGTRTIHCPWYCFCPGDNFVGGLLEALADELDSGETKDLNDILRANGIKTLV